MHTSADLIKMIRFTRDQKTKRNINSTFPNTNGTPFVSFLQSESKRYEEKTTVALCDGNTRLYNIHNVRTLVVVECTGAYKHIRRYIEELYSENKIEIQTKTRMTRSRKRADKRKPARASRVHVWTVETETVSPRAQRNKF